MSVRVPLLLVAGLLPEERPAALAVQVETLLLLTVSGVEAAAEQTSQASRTAQ